VKKVLVVDDEVHITNIVKFTLENEGFQVLTAGDGQEGLRMAREQKPDLIILDLMLPNIDGYKVCRLLKFDEKYRTIPIILLSARSSEADKQLGAEVGADFYMSKPFDPEELALKVKELVAVREKLGS